MKLATCIGSIEVCQLEREWNDRADNVYSFYLRLSLVSDVIILFTSLIVLAAIIFIFKRKDWFLILTPLFFLLHGVTYVPYDIFTVYGNRQA